MTQPKPWPVVPVDREHFENPPREYGILPFWFLNGELDPGEMRYQLEEFRAKGMPGIILHGRYGLEMEYIGPKYLDRIRLAVTEAEKLGLKTWIYDEMNWPSGTADKRVLKARPDLAQRYIECINFTTRGPWFSYLTGADSRYNDFERSTPVAAFALSGSGEVIDLTKYLSFRDVIPWEAPAGNWRLMFIVEKLADYYIDALNPESTAEFLRLGYDPYKEAVHDQMTSQMFGFYTDEPAMHYYLTGYDNPVVPWTKDMFRRFQERNGYNLRPRLPDLFFEVSPDSARVRYDFFNTLTDFYAEAYYKQIQDWCHTNNVLFTGHLLYEEWLRKLPRVEGNLFRHYEHMDVIGVDHLYPIIGTRDRPDEHVALKVASSAAHHLGSPRLLCESFGGLFMDATMQRMKWVADWEYLLGVNLLNPHGFHYTLEGPRKRDWPPSQFYQYPWWRYYGEFSRYMSRLSHLLSGGKHVAKVAMIWPIQSIFSTYTPQEHNPHGDRTDRDFNALTDLLLRLHYDYDYLDEDILARSEVKDGKIHVADEQYELVILPSLTHIKLSTLEKLEAFASQGGRLLGTIFLPAQAFSTQDGQTVAVDISARVQALFSLDPLQTQQDFRNQLGIDVLWKDLPGGGKSAFVRSYAINRQLPLRLQQELGQPGQTESPAFLIETENEHNRYYFVPAEGERLEITDDVTRERQEVYETMQAALTGLLSPDVTVDDPDVFYLHRVKDGRDIYFIINPTQSSARSVKVTIGGDVRPVLWDPTTGTERPLVPAWPEGDRTGFRLKLPPVGSAFVLTEPADGLRILETNLRFDSLDLKDGKLEGYGRTMEAYITLQKDGQKAWKSGLGPLPSDPLRLDGEWEFQTEDANALVLGNWLTAQEQPGKDPQVYASPDADLSSGWLPMVQGAWSYQLPAEPDIPYPIPVWHRVGFRANYLPEKVDLIVDGFDGSEWKLYVNGQPVESAPVRSAIDSQMKAVDITSYLQRGENLVAIRLVVTNPTGGLLDLLKICGDFSLAPQADGSYSIEAPCRSLQPASWTEQGYPYYSGAAVYHKRFYLPPEFAGQRIFLDPVLRDDALEVIINGQPAGVRLWPDYEIEVTQPLQPGENLIELRVANTLVNLLEAVQRPSGLSGVPSLLPYRKFAIEI